MTASLPVEIVSLLDVVVIVEFLPAVTVTLTAFDISERSIFAAAEMVESTALVVVGISIALAEEPPIVPACRTVTSGAAALSSVAS